MGGHGYGTVYPGPIGAILEPQLQGLDRCGELADASSLCGACAEVCPVRIPIPRLLNRLRHERAERRPAARQRFRLQPWLWRGWAWVYGHSGRYRWFRATVTRLLHPLAHRLPLGAWTRSRRAPRVAASSLHRLARQAGFADAAPGAAAAPGDGERRADGSAGNGPEGRAQGRDGAGR
jgi:L-lactate dehydrogenase complex protein LldF